MRALLVETVTATPHTEVGLEIAIKEALAGSEVIYCPLFAYLPNMVWSSNINGKIKAMPDTTNDWLNYVTSVIGKFVTIETKIPERVVNERPKHSATLSYREIYPELYSAPSMYRLPDEYNAYSIYYENLNLGALVKSVIAQRFNSTNFDELHNANKALCAKIIFTAITAHTVAQRLLDFYRPDVVYFFNGRTVTSWPIYKLCDTLGVNQMIFERGSSMHKYFMSNKPPQFVRHFGSEIQRFAKSRSNDARRQAAGVFYSRQKSGEIKNFTYKNKNQNHRSDTIPREFGDDYIAYFASSNYEIFFMPEEDLSNGLGSQVEAVELLANVCRSRNLSLVIRMHPNTPAADRHEYDKLSGNNVFIIYPESDISSYVLGSKSLHNFSYGSTITWEFHFQNIQCATLGITYATDDESVIEISSQESLERYLDSISVPANKNFSLKFADFCHNFGDSFDFYEPADLFSGTFNQKLLSSIR